MPMAILRFVPLMVSRSDLSTSSVSAAAAILSTMLGEKERKHTQLITVFRDRHDR